MQITAVLFISISIFTIAWKLIVLFSGINQYSSSAGGLSEGFSPSTIVLIWVLQNR